MTVPRSKTDRTQRRKAAAPSSNGEVLTLAETAAYLRVSEKEVARLVREQGLPGRKLGDEWRFLKTAVQEWLRSPPSKKEGVLMQIGALQDDPDLGEMLREIHKERGRTDGKGE
jgi:excisionase family DNA binding protein